MQADPLPDLGMRRFSNSHSGFCGELCPESQPSRLDYEKGMGELYIILDEYFVGLTEESDIAIMDSRTGLILRIFDRIIQPSLLIGTNNHLFALSYPEENDSIHDSALSLIEFPSGRLVRSWFPQNVMDFLIKDSSLIVSCDRNSFCVYNLSSPDSTPSWELTFNTSITGTLAESEDIVVIALNETRSYPPNSSKIVAISLDEMKPIWVRDSLPFSNENIVIGDGLVFLRNDQGLHAISLFDGSTVWQNSDVLLCDPAYHKGSVYYSDDQNLIEISSETGKQKNSEVFTGHLFQPRNTVITLCTNGILLQVSSSCIQFFDYSLKTIWIYEGILFSRYLPYRGTISGFTNSLAENQ